MDFVWHIASLIGISLPAILGFNLVFGKGKIFHFGPAGVNLIASYAAFITLAHTGHYGIAFVAGIAASLLLSLLFAWLSLRLESDGMGVMSIAVHLAVLALVLNWSSLTRGALGIPQIPRLSFLSDLRSFALFSLVIAMGWSLFLWRIQRGSFGRALGALAEQNWHATALGINRTRIHILVFLIAGVGSAFTGFLYPQYLHLLHPNDYSFIFFIFYMMVVVAGKPGSVPGVIVSTVLLMLLKEGLRFLPLPTTMLGPLRLILFGCILLAVVWWRRDTLFPVRRSV
jgi:branched-chain amino acid transport system permease protein